MKVTQLPKVKSSKIGHIHYNEVKPESRENETFEYLTLFGFNIELVKPSKTEKSNNPDIFIMGSLWEAKTPTKSNANTIKNRFRKASKQASNVIFDLRFIHDNANQVEEQIIKLFQNGGKVRRMMIIEKDGKILDFYK